MDAPQRRGPLRPARDRHGRGLRGPLAPAGVPVARTRAEQFDELVLASLARLDTRWSAELEGIDIVVADVPDVDATPSGSGSVALGRAEPARSGEPPRLVLHRRTLEARARGLRAREELVHRVLVEQLAELLGVQPADVDPEVSETDD